MTPTATAPSTEEPAARPRFGLGFAAVCGGMFLANLASGISSVAFPWLATSVTDSALLISGVAMLLELPWLLASLPAGVFIDRTNHRWTLAVTHVFRALVATGVALAVAFGSTPLALIYTVAFLIGSATVVNENTSQVVIPRLVPSSLLERANGYLVMTDTVGGLFIGPWLGGLLLGSSLMLPFVFEGGLFGLAAALMVFVVLAPRNRDRPKRTVRAEMAEGLRYFWNHRQLRTLGLFLGLLNLSSAIAVSTQVLFAQTILGLGAAQFGLLFLAGGVGAMLGAWLTSTLERRLGARRILLISLAGNAATSLAIGVASNAVVVAVAIAGGGMLSTIWNVLTVSYRQRIVPEEMMGRVNSIYRLLAWGPLPLGSVLGGLIVTGSEVLTDREFGLRTPLILAALIATVLTVIGFSKLKDGIWSPDYHAGSEPAGQPGEETSGQPGGEK
ncbi:MFS transporter [Streptomyces iconiensis]|uniref:MFS transporter n=1 Tax=Streptomyces iconiensis TaxID=1384038 RepID=A0ABT7A3T8_9ACTN|nr:MFS transporter [Streptomyces iconiensis]MDJ1136008.1 MFS transporter [Streptomyces iconiensis]